jgi:L-ascorbate metabolism protein UlaG (beta-lactamase superfamily)
MKNVILNSIVVVAAAINFFGQHKYEKDVIETSSGRLTMYFIGHSSIMFDYNGKVIYVDPAEKYGTYSMLPKADILLLTHKSAKSDTSVIHALTKRTTQLIITQSLFDELKEGIVMRSGEKNKIAGVEIEAVPTYNTSPSENRKETENGFVINFGNKRVYIAGSLKSTIEASSLKEIDIAFLPVNQPEQIAETVSEFNPRIVYPYHCSDSVGNKLERLLAGNKYTEVRLRSMN